VVFVILSLAQEEQFFILYQGYTKDQLHKRDITLNRDI